MKQDIEEKVKKIIQSCLEDTNLDEINIDDDLADLGINSVNYIQIAVAIEKEFGFEVEDEYLDHTYFKNMKEMIEYISSNI